MAAFAIYSAGSITHGFVAYYAAASTLSLLALPASAEVHFVILGIPLMLVPLHRAPRDCVPGGSASRNNGAGTYFGMDGRIRVSTPLRGRAALGGVPSRYPCRRWCFGLVLSF
jgi:hypothetical protein